MVEKKNAENLDASSQPKRVLMIDLENCPGQIHQLMQSLENYSQVMVCYAQSGCKVPLDWVIPLTKVVNDNRLKIFKMPGNGKNAADFGITFWAGVLMAQSPADVHFDIVSNDADLDHAVNLLLAQKRSAERIGARKENAKETITAINPVAAVVQDYCAYLVAHNKNRPVKEGTLLNSIKSKFNGSGVVPEELIQELKKHGAIAIKENKISYDQDVIIRLAKICL